MQSINRREFLDRSKKGIVGLAAGLPVLADGLTGRAAEAAPHGVRQ